MNTESMKTKPKHVYAITKLINAKNYICYNESVAKIYNPITAIVFAKLVNLYDLFGNNEFYFEQRRIASDTSLSEYQVREAVKELVASKIVLVTKKGIPCKNYYEINISALLELLDCLEKNPDFKFVASESDKGNGSDYKSSNNSRCSSKNFKDKDSKICSSISEKAGAHLKELESIQLEPSNALNSFADAHEFKDAGACTTAEPQTPPSKADCPSLPHTEISPCNEDSSGITALTTDISNSQENPKIQEETSSSDKNSQNDEHKETPSFDLKNSPSQASSQSQAESMSRLNSDTIPGGGFPFADEDKPKKTRKTPAKRKNKRTTLDDTELDGYFALLDPETVRRMHEITESLYKKARIADPLYVRSRNYLRNQTKKLMDFIASSGRTADEVEETFNFGFTDSFWCNVVVSVDVFLRNYTKILQKMRERKPAEQSLPDRRTRTSMVDSHEMGRNTYEEVWQ